MPAHITLHLYSHWVLWMRPPALWCAAKENLPSHTHTHTHRHHDTHAARTKPPCWPQGVILYGEPGTGKTLLAKAVANSTSATFLRVVGSELIQKYLGDGPKLVRELFRVADELSPSIVFIGA